MNSFFIFMTKENRDMKFFKQVKEKLLGIFNEMDTHRSDFVKNPLKNFTRKRKVFFPDIFKWMINLQSQSTEQEILHFYHFDTNHPTASALSQQRDKIKLDAFYYVLHQLNEAFPPPKKYNGYKLVACDGSDVTPL